MNCRIDGNGLTLDLLIPINSPSILYSTHGLADTKYPAYAFNSNFPVVFLPSMSFVARSTSLSGYTSWILTLSPSFSMKFHTSWV